MKHMKKYRLGFDVGGTFTDGVLVQGSKVIAKSKSLTTEDVTSGINLY
jgi:N-methylhydantoinase A/oxoprolinase/acetone carboxylase beta subunit